MKVRLFTTALFLLSAVAVRAEDAPTARQALKPLNDLVGSWRGTGEPEGTRAEKQAGFWVEKIAWEWQFKDKDVWMKVAFENSKHFRGGELRWVPEKKVFRLKVTTPEKQELTFEGPLKNKQLTLERQDAEKKETQRLVFSFYHFNRHVYRYEVQKADAQSFAKKYQVGATKEGVPFATGGDGYPECIVSGGRGTMAVTHKGKTYYVCCSGCRDEFKDNPEKYIAEFEGKQKQK